MKGGTAASFRDPAGEEVDTGLTTSPGACRVIRPELVPFISYPFEWTFGQLRDAALLTPDDPQARRLVPVGESGRVLVLLRRRS